MKKFFIYYDNGYFEVSDSMNITLLHMIDTGVIKIIYNVEEDKAWIRSDEGTAKEVKVCEIEGL
jgi:hypothetical protein